jgi:hypothetical protein
MLFRKIRTGKPVIFRMGPREINILAFTVKSNDVLKVKKKP